MGDPLHHTGFELTEFGFLREYGTQPLLLDKCLLRLLFQQVVQTCILNLH